MHQFVAQVTVYARALGVALAQKIPAPWQRTGPGWLSFLLSPPPAMAGGAGLIQSLRKGLGVAGAEPSPAVPSCRALPPASRLESTENRPAAAG